MTSLVTRATGWTAPESHPEMGNTVDVHNRIRLTSRHVLRDGVPWIPVSGEIHYSRVPRERWRELSPAMWVLSALFVVKLGWSTG